MRELTDVVVVGTGPGGASAAIVCAGAGLSVLLVEKEALPRRKVCGGGLSHKALRALPVPAAPVVERWIASAWVCHGPGRGVLRTLAEPGAMVCRETFDRYLTSEACRRGAELKERCAFLDVERRDGALVIATEQGPVKTRVLVGADGVHSRVRDRTRAGQNVRAVAAVEVLVKPRGGVPAALEDSCLFDFGAVEGGYGWIFPKADHLNVGLYRFRRTPRNADLKAALRRFVDLHPWLAGGEADGVTGFMVPVSPVGGSPERDGVLLVGDAAGLGDALFGEGISFAVRSGCEAGHAIVAHLKNGAPLGDYARRIRSLRRDLFFARLTARGLYRSSVFTFERLVRSPFVNGLFAGVVTGAVSPAACFAQTLAAAPYWLLGKRTDAVPLPPGAR